MAALGDARVEPDGVQFVAFANAVGGLVTGQEMIRGQVALRHSGLLGAPLVNVENACASGATAVQLAVHAIQSGAADVTLAIGAERLTAPERATTFAAIGTAVEVGEAEPNAGSPAAHSPFLDIYRAMAVEYLARTGATVSDLARVVVKSRQHAAGNPWAQFRDPVTVDEVLAARRIVDPLTLPMCSPIGDGAAAVVLASDRAVRRLGLARLAMLRSISVLSGRDAASGPSVVSRAADRAFEEAAVAPTEVDVAEVHDGAAPGELVSVEALGLCEDGGAVRWLRDGTSSLGGRCPINPSGGLLSRGHPIGATGVAQIVELALQLSGRARGRQVEGARIAVAENAGGWLGQESAVAAVTILQSASGLNS